MIILVRHDMSWPSLALVEEVRERLDLKIGCHDLLIAAYEKMSGDKAVFEIWGLCDCRNGAI